jgi:hypothetical protein
MSREGPAAAREVEPGHLRARRLQALGEHGGAAARDPVGLPARRRDVVGGLAEHLAGREPGATQERVVRVRDAVRGEGQEGGDVEVHPEHLVLGQIGLSVEVAGARRPAGT